MTLSGRINESEIERLRNRIYITVNDNLKVFDLVNGELVLVGDLFATKSLLEPQKFVETEH